MSCTVPQPDGCTMKKLTNATLLSLSQASEEFCQAFILSFKALFKALCFCSNSSQSAAVTVGNWLLLMLRLQGDIKAVTLRVLIAKVGTAYQLALFLPCVVSQIGKVLHVSKTIISQAAGSMESMDQALRALTKFLMIVLQDEANISSLDNTLCLSSQEGETGDHGCYTRTLGHMQSHTERKQTNASVCDNDEEVSAHMFLESLFSSSGRQHIQRDFADIFNRKKYVLENIKADHI
ncbi:hypothetical protein Tco_1261396 [Tanacetum coccineum]